jgi:hypothetical protein
MNFIKNITVYQVLLILFWVFIAHATFSVFSKIYEHKKYDMEKILFDIKKEFPFSTLNFQNIRIQGNDEKRSVSRNGAPDSYYESVHVSIKNDKLQKEANFLWLLFLLPCLLFLMIFELPRDPRNLKVKNLNKVKPETFLWIFGSLIISLIIAAPTFNDRYSSSHKDLNAFQRETSILLNKINLENYKVND